MYMYKSMGPFTATLPVAEVKTLVDVLDEMGRNGKRR
jgi:hypothetical protein